MKLNVARAPIFNNEGVAAKRIDAHLALRRSVLACMLWEDSFYESGESIVDRIRSLIPQVDATDCMDLAIQARQQFKLRHVPLLIAREMARLPEHKGLVAHTLEQIIDRPDEITEFLAIYWKDRKEPLSAQVKKGLAAAFAKFGEYALAKYNRDGQVKLRDALFLCHAKPSDARERRYTKLERKEGKHVQLSAGETVFKKLVDNELAVPDTWEVALSAGGDKRETFERLIADKKLGALALLRNLRNMEQSGVPKPIVADALANINVERVLPFRFIAAARAVPQWEDIIEPAMLKCAAEQEKLARKTLLLIDTSPSMTARLSMRSDLTRKDAAFGLAILLREIASDVEIWAFSSTAKQAPTRRGFALGDAINQAVPSNGTLLGSAIRAVSGRYERLIVVTDEESQDAVCDPDRGALAYMINVSSSKNGVGYGAWTHIDGWSEAVIDYIKAAELVAP